MSTETKGCRLIAVRAPGGRSAPTIEHEHEHEHEHERPAPIDRQPSSARKCGNIETTGPGALGSAPKVSELLRMRSTPVARPSRSQGVAGMAATVYVLADMESRLGHAP